VPVLVKFLADSPDNPVVRGFAVEALGLLAGKHPSVRSTVIGVLEHQLARHEENDNDLDGLLVSASIDARAVELIPAIRAAFEAGTVDDTWNGSLEDVEDALVEGPGAG
jgi:hypothetical protein